MLKILMVAALMLSPVLVGCATTQERWSLLSQSTVDMVQAEHDSYILKILNDIQSGSLSPENGQALIRADYEKIPSRLDSQQRNAEIIQSNIAAQQVEKWQKQQVLSNIQSKSKLTATTVNNKGEVSQTYYN